MLIRSILSFVTICIISINVLSQSSTVYSKNLINNKDSVSRILQEYYRKLKRSNNLSDKNIIQNNIDQLIIVYDSLLDQITKLDLQFAKNNPSSFSSLNKLRFRFLRQEGIIYADTIIQLFNNLAPHIKNSEKGKEFEKLILNFKNSSVGNKAPDFSSQDINNQIVKLSSFLDTGYVLLDFWASWCAPCRDDIPFLKELYEKYENKGFNIIGISRDESMDNWKNAIEKDSTQNWYHISEPYSPNNNPIADQYFVTAIPIKVLINREGIIIGRWRGGGKENKEELKKMLEEIFLARNR